MKQMISSKLLALPLLASVAACTVGPNYKGPPSVASDAVARKAFVRADETTTSAAPALANWWEGLGDPTLNALVQDALAHNPDVDIAQARIRAATAQVEQHRAEQLPSASANATYLHARLPGVSLGGSSSDSGAGSDGSSGGSGSSISSLNFYNLGGNASWEVDLFGGTRRGIEAQAALADVQQAQADATWLTLAANVVTASLQEASLREQVRATEAIADSQRDSVRIAERQQQIGATSLAATLAARSELAATEATLPPLRARLAATRNQLATYLGSTPAQLELSPLPLDAIALPRDIPVSLPSRLVAQRPDIRAASAQLHAATARVGVATAAMLPQITLSGSAGSQTAHVGELFSAGSRAWSLGLGLTQPLFHGGELRHRKRAAEAGLDKALADWQQTVLVAFQNVADALQALQYDADGLAAQLAAEDAAAQRLALAQRQYRVGASGYLDLLQAQRDHQRARIALIQARTARLADTAALYAALGGSWQHDIDEPLTRQDQ